MWPGGTIWSWISYEHQDDVEQVVHQHCHSYFINPWMLTLCTCALVVTFTVQFTVNLSWHSCTCNDNNITEREYKKSNKNTTSPKPIIMVKQTSMVSKASGWSNVSPVLPPLTAKLYCKGSIRVLKGVGTDDYALQVRTLSHKKMYSDSDNGQCHVPVWVFPVPVPVCLSPVHTRRM